MLQELSFGFTPTDARRVASLDNEFQGRSGGALPQLMVIVVLGANSFCVSESGEGA
jgi:hypothetical protein